MLDVLLTGNALSCTYVHAFLDKFFMLQNPVIK